MELFSTFSFASLRPFINFLFIGTSIFTHVMASSLIIDLYFWNTVWGLFPSHHSVSSSRSFCSCIESSVVVCWKDLSFSRNTGNVHLPFPMNGATGLVTITDMSSWCVSIPDSSISQSRLVLTILWVAYLWSSLTLVIIGFCVWV